MEGESIVTLAVLPSEGFEGQRNRKTRILSALLSASALGVFLEGCGGGDQSGDGNTGGEPPTISVVGEGSEDAPYLAGAGADTFAGSGGANWVNYAESQEGVTIDLGTETATVDGGAAGDTLTGINNLIGSNQDDNLEGNSEANTLRGGGGADTLDGGVGTDTLAGGEGDDVLEGGVGADTLAGGAGDDKVLYDSAGEGVKVDLSNTERQADFDGTHGFTANTNEAVGDTITDVEDVVGSAHNDWLTGDGEDNDLHGGGGNDRLEGGVGADRLEGGEGDDVLEGGVGADTLAGGAGDDKVLYENAGEGVKVDLSNTGTQADFDGTHGFTANTNEAVGDTLTDVEDVVGSDHNDWLTGDNEDNDLQGGAGSDRLEGGVGADTLDGGIGADTLEGGAGADIYAFGAGDGTDTVTDDGGNIVFEQGTGNDYTGASYSFVRADEGRGAAVTLTVKDSNDNTLNVLEFTNYPLTSSYTFYTRDASGSDIEIPTSLLVVPPRLTVEGSEGNPFLATDAADTFTGSEGADWVSYAGSTSYIDIDLSNDPTTVSGGATDDTLSGINNLIGSDYNDRLIGNDNANILRGGDDNDGLYGDEGDDSLYGGEDDDDLEGGDGNDYLYGEGGTDTLNGDEGNDYLNGGEGEDTYAFEVGDGTDIIRDEVGDTMILQFEGSAYTAADFVSANINKAGDDLVITIDKDLNDGITDKVTINNAYDTDPNTGTGNAAFTINIEFGTNGIYTEVTNDFWHTL